MKTNLGYEVNTKENEKLEKLDSNIKNITTNYFAFDLNPLIFEEIEKEAKNKMIPVNTLVSQILQRYIEVTYV